jgi:hypothetical protein
MTDDETEEEFNEDAEVNKTRRWRGMTALALFAGGAGVLTDRPLVLLTAAVWVGYAAYPRLTGEPTVEIEVERKLSDDHPVNLRCTVATRLLRGQR